MQFNYIDVGSNGGIVYPWKKSIIKNILNFDPQDNNARQICIFSEEGERDFFVSKKKDCSSLFEPDYKVFEKCRGKKNMEGYLIEKIIKVQCRRLDSIIEEDGREYDFMKTDTQGADLDVLQSCGKYLENFVGIHIEVFFEPVYKNIPLFSDIEKFLLSMNFKPYAKYVRKKCWGDFLFVNKRTHKIHKRKYIKNLYSSKRRGWKMI